MSQRDLQSTGPLRLTRRHFTSRLAWGALGVSGLGVAAARSRAEEPDAPARSQRTAEPEASLSSERPAPRALLEESPYVYISPLRRDGSESTCHGELWYAWMDGAVVVTVAKDRWKATALARGLDRARIWVGDHGRWKTWYGGTDESFRKAPSFVARAEQVRDPGLIEPLLARYEEKYPAEIADWRDAMREGSADGSRILIRYTPVG